MIDDTIATFRLRSLGDFSLSNYGLLYMGPSDPLDDQELAREYTEEVFSRVFSHHGTIQETVNLVRGAYMLSPDALSNVVLTDPAPVPPLPEGGVR